MSWQTPKTNWPVEDVPGVGDFERIEGNTEYLKTQTDGLKSGSIKAAKASNAEYATNAGYANSAGKFKKGEVTVGQTTPLDSRIITHNFGSTNIIVTVGRKTTNGVISGGGYRIIDSNRVEIFATHDGPEATYVYTIFKP